MDLQTSRPAWLQAVSARARGGACVAAILTAIPGLASAQTLVVGPGQNVTTDGPYTASGADNAILVSPGAGRVTLGAGPMTSTGSGNALENAGDDVNIRTNGTVFIATGTGTAVRTAVPFLSGSTASISAAGANSTGFAFTGTGGTVIASDFSLDQGTVIAATGAGAVGLRLNTTGNVVLDSQIASTNIGGGAAVVAGPAASVTNEGTITSLSRTAPAIDFTSGNAFTNTGTIKARSYQYVAIQGGAGTQSVTLSDGSLTGIVDLGDGADTFVMSGGTFDGSLRTGAGNDTVTFRNLEETNMTDIRSIDGGGVVGGNDTLVFDNTRTAQTRRLVGWNNINVVNGAGLKMNGDLVLVNGGTLTIDSTSEFLAGNNRNAAITGGPGGTVTVVNAGQINLANGPQTGAAATSDTLTIRGNYVGQNGRLKLHAFLGGDGSPADRLIIDGGTVSGSTTILIENAGGLGQATTGNGIEVVSAINGGTTTALTTGTGFVLGGGHVDAGAFEYRLFASDLTGTSESWYLRTTTDDQTEVDDGGDDGDDDGGDQQTDVDGDGGGDQQTDVAYRVEAPLLAAVPGVLRQGDLSMLATYHRRMGDQTGTVADGFTTPGRIWGRAIYEDGRTRQGGALRPTTDGRNLGFQIGVDVFRYRPESGGQHSAGLYGGYLDGSYNVRGFASGVENTRVGRLLPYTYYAGAYWTYVSDSGFYTDVVVQHSWYRGRAEAVNGNKAAIRGTGALASVEAGYGFSLSDTWTLEPQAQLIAQTSSIRDMVIPASGVQYASNDQITGRIGLRLRGKFEREESSIQPYLRANLWKAFESGDRTVFVTPAASTVFDTPNRAVWGEAGAGVTWGLASGLSFYGEVTHRFSLDDGQGVVGHTTGGSIGVKYQF